MFLYGGRTSLFNVASDLWSFDTREQTWSHLSAGQSGDLPGPREHHTLFGMPSPASIVASAPLVGLLGGAHASANTLSSLFVLDTSSLVWTERRTMGEVPSFSDVSSYVLAPLGDHVYLIARPLDASPQIFSLDLVSFSWKNLTSTVKVDSATMFFSEFWAMGGAGSATSGNGVASVRAVGDEDSGSMILVNGRGDVWEFTPEARSLSSLLVSGESKDFPKRKGFCAALSGGLTGSKTLHVFGGAQNRALTASGYLNDVLTLDLWKVYAQNPKQVISKAHSALTLASSTLSHIELSDTNAAAVSTTHQHHTVEVPTHVDVKLASSCDVADVATHPQAVLAFLDSDVNTTESEIRKFLQEVDKIVPKNFGAISASLVKTRDRLGTTEEMTKNQRAVRDATAVALDKAMAQLRGLISNARRALCSQQSSDSALLNPLLSSSAHVRSLSSQLSHAQAVLSAHRAALLATKKVFWDQMQELAVSTPAEGETASGEETSEDAAEAAERERLAQERLSLLLSQLSATQNELSNAQSQLKSAQSDLSTALHSLSSAERESSDLRSRLTETEGKVSVLQSRLDISQNEREALISHLKSAGETEKRLKEKVLAVEDSMLGLQELLQREKEMDRRDENEKKVIELTQVVQEQKEKLRVTADVRTQESAKSAAEIERLTNRVVVLEADKENLESRLRSLEDEKYIFQQKVEENENIGSLLSALRAEVGKKRTELEDLTDVLESRDGSIAELRLEVSKLKMELESAVVGCKFSPESHDQHQRVRSLESQVDEHIVALTKRENELFVLRNQMTPLQQKVMDAEARVVELNEMIANFVCPSCDSAVAEVRHTLNDKIEKIKELNGQLGTCAASVASAGTENSSLRSALTTCHTEISRLSKMTCDCPPPQTITTTTKNVAEPSTAASRPSLFSRIFSLFSDLPMLFLSLVLFIFAFNFVLKLLAAAKNFISPPPAEDDDNPQPKLPANFNSNSGFGSNYNYQPGAQPQPPAGPGGALGEPLKTPPHQQALLFDRLPQVPAAADPNAAISGVGLASPPTPVQALFQSPDRPAVIGQQQAIGRAYPDLSNAEPLLNDIDDGDVPLGMKPRTIAPSQRPAQSSWGFNFFGYGVPMLPPKTPAKEIFSSVLASAKKGVICGFSAVATPLKSRIPGPRPVTFNPAEQPQANNQQPAAAAPAAPSNVGPGAASKFGFKMSVPAVTESHQAKPATTATAAQPQQPSVTFAPSLTTNTFAAPAVVSGQIVSQLPSVPAPAVTSQPQPQPPALNFGGFAGFGALPAASASAPATVTAPAPAPTQAFSFPTQQPAPTQPAPAAPQQPLQFNFPTQQAAPSQQNAFSGLTTSAPVSQPPAPQSSIFSNVGAQQPTWAQTAPAIPPAPAAPIVPAFPTTQPAPSQPAPLATNFFGATNPAPFSQAPATLPSVPAPAPAPAQPAWGGFSLPAQQPSAISDSPLIPLADPTPIQTGIVSPKQLFGQPEAPKTTSTWWKTAQPESAQPAQPAPTVSFLPTAAPAATTVGASKDPRQAAKPAAAAAAATTQKKGVTMFVGFSNPSRMPQGTTKAQQDLQKQKEDDAATDKKLASTFRAASEVRLGPNGSTKGLTDQSDAGSESDTSVDGSHKRSGSLSKKEKRKLKQEKERELARQSLEAIESEQQGANAFDALASAAEQQQQQQPSRVSISSQHKAKAASGALASDPFTASVSGSLGSKPPTGAKQQQQQSDGEYTLENIREDENSGKIKFDVIFDFHLLPSSQQPAKADHIFMCVYEGDGTSKKKHLPMEKVEGTTHKFRLTYCGLPGEAVYMKVQNSTRFYSLAAKAVSATSKGTLVTVPEIPSAQPQEQPPAPQQTSFFGNGFAQPSQPQPQAFGFGFSSNTQPQYNFAAPAAPAPTTFGSSASGFAGFPTSATSGFGSAFPTVKAEPSQTHNSIFGSAPPPPLPPIPPMQGAASLITGFLNASEEAPPTQVPSFASSGTTLGAMGGDPLDQPTRGRTRGTATTTATATTKPARSRQSMSWNIGQDAFGQASNGQQGDLFDPQ